MDRVIHKNSCCIQNSGQAKLALTSYILTSNDTDNNKKINDFECEYKTSSRDASKHNARRNIVLVYAQIDNIYVIINEAINPLVSSP